MLALLRERKMSKQEMKNLREQAITPGHCGSKIFKSCDYWLKEKYIIGIWWCLRAKKIAGWITKEGKASQVFDSLAAWVP